MFGVGTLPTPIPVFERKPRMAKILKQTSLSISSLPDGCSMKSALESYVADTGAQVNVVLTLDGGQYVAYIGYPDKNDLRPELRSSSHMVHHCETIRTPQQVVKLGDRLDDETRDYLFPVKERS
jgi:hypothetical protein